MTHTGAFLDTPTETAEPTWTPLAPFTETDVPTSTHSPTPGPTQAPPLVIVVHTELELTICTQIEGAVCAIVGSIHLTQPLSIVSANITIRGGSITNVPEYPGRLVAILRTADVRLEGVKIYGTLALQKSAIKDCLLILQSTRVTLDHVTLAHCEDENGDIVNSTGVAIQNSVFIQPLRNAMHTKGAHPYNMLITDSEVLIKDSVFSSGQARNPQAQNSRLTLENVLLDNIDGSGIQVTCGTVLNTSGLMIRGGWDTDEQSYGIAAVNPDECIELPLPVITEKCSLVSGWHIASNGNKYPRVRRYGGDRPHYTNPVTTDEFLSDTVGCVKGDIERTITNAGSPETPACLVDALCRIVDRAPN